MASLVAGVASLSALLAWIFLAFPIAGHSAGRLCLAEHSQPARRAGRFARGQGRARPLGLVCCCRARLAVVSTRHRSARRLRADFLRTVAARCRARRPVPIPSSAMALEGKKVFIKGYVYPGREMEGIKTFLLVRDQGDCCFGGNPKITDRIQVTLVDPLRLTYKPRLHKLAGVFHVRPTTAVDCRRRCLLPTRSRSSAMTIHRADSRARRQRLRLGASLIGVAGCRSDRCGSPQTAVPRGRRQRRRGRRVANPKPPRAAGSDARSPRDATFDDVKLDLKKDEPFKKTDFDRQSQRTRRKMDQDPRLHSAQFSRHGHQAVRAHARQYGMLLRPRRGAARLPSWSKCSTAPRPTSRSVR